jgi:hypothetical protein
LRPEKKLQPPHVVSQIHQSDLHRRPDLALALALVAKDMLTRARTFERRWLVACACLFNARRLLPL